MKKYQGQNANNYNKRHVTFDQKNQPYKNHKYCQRCNFNILSHQHIQPSYSQPRLKTMPSQQPNDAQRKINNKKIKLQKLNTKKDNNQSLRILPQFTNINPEHEKQHKLKSFIQNNQYFIDKWQQQQFQNSQRFKQKLKQNDLKSIKKNNKSNKNINFKISNNNKQLGMIQMMRLKTEAYQSPIKIKKSPQQLNKINIINPKSLKSSVQVIIKHLQQCKQELQIAKKKIKKQMKSQQKQKLALQKEKQKRRIIKQIEKQYDIYNLNKRKKKVNKNDEYIQQKQLQKVEEVDQFQYQRRQNQYDKNDRNLVYYTNDFLPVQTKNIYIQTDQIEILKKKQISIQVTQKQSQNNDIIQRKIKINVPFLKKKQKRYEQDQNDDNKGEQYTYEDHKTLQIYKNNEIYSLNRSKQHTIIPIQLKQQEQQITLGLRQNPEQFIS